MKIKNKDALIIGSRINSGDMVCGRGNMVRAAANTDELNKVRRVRRHATRTLFRCFRQHGIKIGNREKNSIIENIVRMTEPVGPILGIALNDCKPGEDVNVMVRGIVSMKLGE